MGLGNKRFSRSRRYTGRNPKRPERRGAPLESSRCPPAITTSEAPPAKPARMLSLDVLRGLTIGFMILVNNNGDGERAYWALKHAAWNGFTPTDLVFPTFLFLVGVSIVFSTAGASRARRVQAVALPAHSSPNGDSLSARAAGQQLSLLQPAHYAFLRGPAAHRDLLLCGCHSLSLKSWLAGQSSARQRSHSSATGC